MLFAKFVFQVNLLSLLALCINSMPSGAVQHESIIRPESGSGDSENSTDEGLIAAFVTDEVAPFSAELLCKYSPGLNEAQRNVCIQYPAAMPVLQEVINLIQDECSSQLKGERWNCTSVVPPIVGEQSSELTGATKEGAFTHALTSAAMVYAITKACSEGRINNCGCDTTLNGKENLQGGWQWGGCSDDVEFGAQFASKFLDARETEGKSENELGLSLVNLHNNAAGRMIVQQGMKLECRCHGVSGSCSAKTCWRKVPDMEDIGQNIKDKYDESIKVSVQITKSEQPSLRSVSDDQVSVSTSHLVHLQKSQDFCSKANYTQDRKCVAIKHKNYYNVDNTNSNSTTSNTNSTIILVVDESLPACEDFCCGGEYTEEVIVNEENCNCKFSWCCDVVCENCITKQYSYTCNS